MAYGNGTIEPRGNNRWRITWYAAGKRRRKTVRGTITAARRELRQRVAEVDQGGIIDHRKVKVSELLADLLDDYRSKGQDVETCARRVKNLRPFFGNLLACRVGTDTVRAFGPATSYARECPSTLSWRSGTLEKGARNETGSEVVN